MKRTLAWTNDRGSGAEQDDVAVPTSTGSCTESARQGPADPALLQCYQTVFSQLPHGICVFDDHQRLLLSNSRYATIFGLDPAAILPGMTLAEIIERRAAAGLCPAMTNDYHYWCKTLLEDVDGKTWTVQLEDGRTILVSYQPLKGGGWIGTFHDISEQKHACSITNQQFSMQSLIDWIPDYLYVKDTDSRFLVANAAIAIDCNRSNPRDLIGLSDFEIHDAASATQFREVERRLMASGEAMMNVEERILDSTRADKWMSSTKVPLRDAHGHIFGLMGIGRDITQRKLAEALRDRQAEVLEAIATGAPLGAVLDQLVWLVEAQIDDVVGGIFLLEGQPKRLQCGAAPNASASVIEAIERLAVDEAAGIFGLPVLRPEPAVGTAECHSQIKSELPSSSELRSCWSSPILSQEGRVLGLLAICSSSARPPTAAEVRLAAITTRIAAIAIERKRAEDRIRFMATQDPLTGLANRSGLKDALDHALAAARSADRWVSVVFIDLDNFKIINDSLGHQAGDDVLKQVAREMLALTRPCDTVVRFGGDEFVMVLADLPKDRAAIEAVIQRVWADLQRPCQIGLHSICVTGSLGVAIYPDDGQDGAALVANADASMYRAKETGRNAVQFYSAELNASAHEKLQIREALRRALARSEFLLHYQPQIDARTGRIVSTEALLRWQHPTLGLVPPIRFISEAEEIGAIVEIGDWVLNEACRQTKAWHDAGLPKVGISVNVSARQFKDAALVCRVKQSLAASRLAASYLELELTETMIMHDVERAVHTMRQLRALGVSLSIDDFGTGYSSLSALKTFPVARLKIDQSFIVELNRSEGDRAVARAVISLGHQLHLKVIAEGVENDEHAAFLRENDCDEMQGYLFSKPLPAPAMAELLGRQAAGLSETAFVAPAA